MEILELPREYQLKVQILEREIENLRRENGQLRQDILNAQREAYEARTRGRLESEGP